jgi:hypothetical protein
MSMVVQYSEEDISRVFGKNAILKFQRLVADGLISIKSDGNRINGEVTDEGTVLSCYAIPQIVKNSVIFSDHSCSCGHRLCKHVAAITFLALDKDPQRRAPTPVPGATGYRYRRKPKRRKLPGEGPTRFDSPNSARIPDDNSFKQPEDHPKREDIADANPKVHGKRGILSLLLSAVHRLFSSKGR